MIFLVSFLVLGYVASLGSSAKIFHLHRSEVEKFENLLKSGNGEVITAKINDYADSLLSNIDSYMIEKQLDPFSMPDVSKSFSRLLMSGEFKLSDGKLHDISTLRRDGDCSVSYDRDLDNVELEIPLAFKDLTFEYNYKIKYMTIGPKGKCTGSVNKIKMRVKMCMDFNEYKAELEEYKLLEFGKISIKFHGNLIYDWLVDIVSDLSCEALDPIIKGIIQNIIGNTLDTVINGFNSIVQNILHCC